MTSTSISCQFYFGRKAISAVTYKNQNTNYVYLFVFVVLTNVFFYFGRKAISTVTYKNQNTDYGFYSFFVVLTIFFFYCSRAEAENLMDDTQWHKCRWRSIRIAHLTGFLWALGSTCNISSIWPYLKQVRHLELVEF